jgi:hypothetical protein
VALSFWNVFAIHNQDGRIEVFALGNDGAIRVSREL